VPMHFKTLEHSKEVFADVKPLEEFVKHYGINPDYESKLTVEKSRLGEETSLVVLTSPHGHQPTNTTS